MNTKIIFVLVFLLAGGMVQTAGAITVTENTDMGWQTLINNDYVNNSYIDNIFLATDSNSQNVTGATSSIQNYGYQWNTTSSVVGRIYIGQLYPAGRTRFRFNLSLQRNLSAGTPFIHIYDGTLFDVQIFRFNTTYTIYLNYYNETGVLKQTSNNSLTSNQPYVDILIDYYPNGSTTLYNNSNLSQSVTARLNKTHTSLPTIYIYNYASSNIINIPSGYNGNPYLNMSIYNFEQQIPKKLITVLSDNTTFPIGFDDRGANTTPALYWLLNNSQSATLWEHPLLYPNFSAADKTLRHNLLNNSEFELGIHYNGSLSNYNISHAQNVIDTETPIVSGFFGNTPVLSWVSLGNSENSTNALYAWESQHELWRNIPNSNEGLSMLSYTMLSPGGGSTDSNIPLWDISSQHKAFNPTYVHSATNPLQETGSINLSDFTRIMSNYTSSGIKIIPYAEWYYESNNTVQPITNIYLSPTLSYFNINTTGYNATTQINDPNGIGNEFWYANGGWVKTTISTSNITNITINTPLNLTVKKANGTITPADYNSNFTATVTTWNETGDFKISFYESSTNHANTASHTITNAGWDNKAIVVNKNGALYNLITADASGTISFNYVGGYSNVRFDMQPATPEQNYVFSSCNTVADWGRIGFAFLTVLFLAIGGSYALGWLRIPSSFNDADLMSFMLLIIVAVVFGLIAVAIVSPVYTLMGC